jgi:shikimate kinase
MADDEDEPIMILKLKQTPGIYLAGFMASGKSTIGRKLAERLGWRFVDLDDDIEAAAGCPITEIFEKQGEARFREIESAAIVARVKQVIHGQPTVMALGGGSFTRPQNIDVLEQHGVTIWLDCPFEMVERRTADSNHRPLARDREKFAELYEARKALYGRAEHRIAIESDDPEDAVKAVLALGLL